MILNFESDYWTISPTNPTIEKMHRLDFSHFQSDTLKQQVKKYFEMQIKMNNLGRTTLCRYCYAWKVFNEFMLEVGIKINFVDELNIEHIESYILYLNKRFTSSGTRGAVYAGMKSVIVYGQMLELDRFPKAIIFPGDESRLFNHDDELKSKDIEIFVLKQIDQAIQKETDVYIKTMVAIARHTGIRLSEILTIKSGCVVKDFLDKSILCTYSFKNDKERAIPINDDLALIIMELENKTREIWINSSTPYLFSHISRKGDIKIINQTTARISLKNFIHRHKIIDENNEPVTNVSFHQFRHTVGTQSINNGITPREIMEMLGHESLHSSSLYVKLWDKTVDEDYQKVGFIGIVTRSIEECLGENYSSEKQVRGTLPDGFCKQAFNTKEFCDKFNKCLLCPKFITTLEHLPIHKQHLKRIQADKIQYMHDMHICNLQKIEKIEAALIVIINQLEVLANEKGK